MDTLCGHTVCSVMINDIALRGRVRTGLAIEAVEIGHCARRGSMRRKLAAKLQVQFSL